MIITTQEIYSQNPNNIEVGVPFVFNQPYASKVLKERTVVEFYEPDVESDTDFDAVDRWIINKVRLCQTFVDDGKEKPYAFTVRYFVIVRSGKDISEKVGYSFQYKFIETYKCWNGTFHLLEIVTDNDI